MRSYTLKLAAGASTGIRSKGRYVVVKSATGAVAISTPDGKINLSGLTDGQGAKGIPFVDLIITDESGATNTVVIVVAEEEGELITALQIAGNVNLAVASSSTYGSVTVTASAGQIPAGTRKSITFQPDPSSSYVLTIGTTAGTGIQLSGGQIASTTNTGAIDLRSTGTITVGYWAEV